MVFELLFNEDGVSKRDALGHGDTLVQSCVFNGKPSLDQGQCMSLLELSYDPDYGNCYTVPGHTPDGRVLEARESDFWQEVNDLVLLLDLETSEFLERKRHPGVIVTIHDDSTLPDVHTDGIQLSSGYSYTFGMQKSTVRLLQKPYKTNCTNFDQLPWHLGPRRETSRMCTVGCSQYFQFTECGFITKNLSLFYSILPYKLESVTSESKRCAKNVELRTQDYCRTVCGLPCRDTTFPVTVGSSFLTKRDLLDYSIHSWKNRTWDENLRNLALVKIFFSTLEHKIFRHRPKYETMELFSYLGGYSGVWLGFSLLTVYEMLEICFRTFLRALPRGKSKSSRNNRRRKKRTAKKIFFYE